MHVHARRHMMTISSRFGGTIGTRDSDSECDSDSDSDSRAHVSMLDTSYVPVVVVLVLTFLPSAPTDVVVLVRVFTLARFCTYA